MEIEKFYEMATRDESGRFFLPNPLQRAVWEKFYDSNGHPAMLVRAGTGAGKTEAVLFPALADERTRRRIVMILPSKALIEDMGRRLKKIGGNLTANQSRELDITVDMGGSCKRYRCRNGTVETNAYHRHLFADDLIVTTLDKFLFRMFGYGEKNKSYIFPHRIFGSAVEKRPFVVFDEAHEYDRLSFSNFIRLLRTLFVKGKDLCVMSATLPGEFVDFLDPVDAIGGELGRLQNDFFKKSARHTEKKIRLIASQSLSPSAGAKSPKSAGGESCSGSTVVEAIAETVRLRHDASKRTIARVESVADLQKLYAALKDKKPLAYHGRMTARQRAKVIDSLISAQRKGQGFLVVATSAIEAGCDLDAHLIATQLCNPDSLVQLAGRLNRRGNMKNAEIVVAGEKIPNFVCDLDPDRLAEYYKTLVDMEGNFQPGMLETFFRPPTGDWMGEVLFDMLWEYVYEADLTGKPLWDKGILVTRSWEPAVTLCTGKDKHGRPVDPVQVGISRLAAKISRSKKDDFDVPFKDWLKKQTVREKFSVEENGQWHAEIFRAFFNPGNPEESRWKLTPLTGNYISCYEASLVCVVKPEFKSEYFDEVLGYVKMPKLFLFGYKDGFQQYLDYLPEFKKDGRLAIPSDSAYPKRAGRVWFLDKPED